jgi:hypothetical protein
VVNSTPVSLSKDEYALLLAFLEAPPRWLSREHLLYCATAARLRWLVPFPERVRPWSNSLLRRRGARSVPVPSQPSSQALGLPLRTQTEAHNGSWSLHRAASGRSRRSKAVSLLGQFGLPRLGS